MSPEHPIETQTAPESPVTAAPEKQNILADLADEKQSAAAKYRSFFVGTPGLVNLLRYELAMGLARPAPGALGYLLRKLLYTPLMGGIGAGVQWGHNVSLRHPGKMHIGAHSAFDDGCVLDARGTAAGDFTIGERVLVASGSVLLAKSGFLRIGANCSIGTACFLGSFGGIQIGAHVGIAGHCYIGGARYRTDRTDIPMKDQPAYSDGPIVIGDDCWIGANVTILDNVVIGRGSIIGAGAVIREHVPELSIVMPQQRLITMKRPAR